MTTTPAALRIPEDVQTLLRGVSRSFYLSIRLLPRALRRPVGLAYLLARATDTVADTASLPASQRMETLDVLRDAVETTSIDGRLVRVTQSFAQLQRDPHEQRLVQCVPQCVHGLHEASPQDREAIQAVMRHITRGQALDVQRFAEPGALVALRDAGELEEYTYLVAGSVGEFWTDLCLRHLPRFASEASEQMHAWGRAYGSGLQLVNILRDAGADLAQGRCYLPADELAAAGLTPAEAAADPARLAPVWLHWRGIAGQRLGEGMEYALAVRSARVRAASALPALLGVRTLALLDSAGPAAFSAKVKVPRADVRKVLWRVFATLARRQTLRSEFERLAQGDGARGWDNPAR
jgi:farnesyl-diphosphate farnesyltransferase